MRLPDDSYGIDVGTFVMNCHQGLLRLGVVASKRANDQGWTQCVVDWLEDDIHTARVAWDKRMGSPRRDPEEVRVDWLKPVSTEWLQNVLTAYGDRENERRTDFS